MTQAMHQVLIIEDEPAIRTVLRVLLEAQGYRVVEADTAARAEIETRSHKPDLLLVDLGLPDEDGLKVIRRVRAWSQVPVVVLSARTMEEQKIAALDAGADDYVTKPFSAPELLARLRAALRRDVRGAAPAALLRFATLRVDLARREAQGAQGELHLTPLEYRVLACLARHPLGERHDQFGGVAAPVDGDDEGALPRLLRDLGLLARQHARHGDDEVAAEVAARVAGDGVGHLADQVAHGLVTEVVLLHLHQQHGQHRLGRGEVDDALALAGDVDDAGVFVHRRGAFHEIGRADRSRLLRGDLEEIRRPVDEGLELLFVQHCGVFPRAPSASVPQWLR